MQFTQHTQAKRFFVTVGKKEIGFSKREIQILTLMKGRMTAKHIAKTLDIAPHTVNCYKENIKKKLGEECDELNRAIQSDLLNEEIW